MLAIMAIPYTFTPTVLSFMVNGSFVEMLHFTQSALSFTFGTSEKERSMYQHTYFGHQQK